MLSSLVGTSSRNLPVQLFAQKADTNGDEFPLDGATFCLGKVRRALDYDRREQIEKMIGVEETCPLSQALVGAIAYKGNGDGSWLARQLIIEVSWAIETTFEDLNFTDNPLSVVTEFKNNRKTRVDPAMVQAVMTSGGAVHADDCPTVAPYAHMRSFVKLRGLGKKALVASRYSWAGRLCARYLCMGKPEFESFLHLSLASDATRRFSLHCPLCVDNIVPM